MCCCVWRKKTRARTRRNFGCAAHGSRTSCALTGGRSDNFFLLPSTSYSSFAFPPSFSLPPLFSPAQGSALCVMEHGERWRREAAIEREREEGPGGGRSRSRVRCICVYTLKNRREDLRVFAADCTAVTRLIPLLGATRAASSSDSQNETR